MTPARWALALACTVAFWFRAVTPYYHVFQSGFINFQETDAWFHVRIMEHLVRNFPFRLALDPYGSISDGQRVDTGPFFDWIPALLALPYPSAIQTVAAWYPAILGVLIVIAVFFLTRELFGELAAALAALTVATLPGYFLVVTSLGFTDHHAMESLLSVAVLYFLIRRQSFFAGLALAAYLLTFVGGALLVAIATAWAVYQFLRFPADADSTGNLFPVFAVPLLFVLPYLGKIIWMEYTVAALAAGLAVAAGVHVCRRTRYPRAIWLGAVAAVAALALALFPQALSILRMLNPGRSAAAGTILELQSFWFANGRFSLDWARIEFGGVYLLLITGILLLTLATLRGNNPPRALFTIWALAIFALSILQVRMIYYIAPVAAVITGHLIQQAWSLVSPKGRPVVAAAAFALAFAPNIWSLVAKPPLPTASVPVEWRDALEWLRAQTPEPFGDPNAYFANGVSPQLAQYGVLSWWDYGYWISAIGRRVPLTNPTQKNASVAAQFFLARSEAEARQIMIQWRLRYIMMDHRLGDSFFSAYIAFLPGERIADYLIEGLEKMPDGVLRKRRFYLPAYYQTMAARLTAGGEGSDPTGPAAVVTPSAPDAVFRQIRSFSNVQDAAQYQSRCASIGCLLVGEQPGLPIVPVAPLESWRQVYPDRRGPAPVAIFDSRRIDETKSGDTRP